MAPATYGEAPSEMPKRSKCKCQDPTAVAILARISDREKQGQPSLEAQIRETRERLTDPKGWHVVAEYAIKHRGSDLSGDPRYMEMIRDARAGKFSKLCLHKFDRFARRSYDREVFEHILTRECGIEIYAALEPYDLKTRAGQLTKKTSAFISDVFLDNLREESLKGMTQKILAGGWVARAPVGYLNKREEIGHNKFRRWVEPDPLHRETVQLAFRLFAGGQHTLDSLTAYLNEHGLTWQGGRPWTRDRLHRMLINPFYAGRLRWNGLEAAGIHEPLIDQSTWEACRAVRRSHDKSKERKARHVYPLVGVLYFAELGCGAHAETQTEKGISYYRSRLQGAGGSKIYLPCEEAEARAAEILEDLQIPPELVAPIKKAYRHQVAEIAAPEAIQAQRLKRQLAQLEEESRGYVRLAAQGKITETEFDSERARVSSAIAKTRHELAAVEGGGRSRLSDLDAALVVFAHAGLLWNRSDDTQRKALTRLFFRRISITNAGDVVDVELADPFAYLETLKKASAPPEGRGLHRSNSVRYALPNATYTELAKRAPRIGGALFD